MEKVMAIVSGKGGVGKTMIASNLGVVLSRMGKKTVILDLNFQARSADLALGLESGVIYDIGDVLEGTCRLRQALVRHKEFEGLAVMEPPIAKESCQIGPIEVKVLCEKLSEIFDVILLDLAAGADEAFEGIISLAQRILVVTNQDPSSVRAVECLLKKMDKRGTKKKKLLVNQVKMKLTERGYLTSVEDIAELLGIELCGVIPYDEHIHVAFNNGSPIAGREDSRGGEYIRRIAERFLEE